MDFEEFRLVLDSLNISQAELGRILDVTPRTVNLWAQGLRSVPGPVRAYLRLRLSQFEMEQNQATVEKRLDRIEMKLEKILAPETPL